MTWKPSRPGIRVIVVLKVAVGRDGKQVIPV